MSGPTTVLSVGFASILARSVEPIDARPAGADVPVCLTTDPAFGGRRAQNRLGTVRIMGVIVKWFIAGNDEQAATAIGGWDELHRFPTADVGLTATYAWPHLEAILTGRTVDDIKADGGHTFVAAVGDGDVGIMRLSPGLVRSVGEAPDDTVPIIARSWAEATGHEPGEDEARWILQQAVPLFRRALAEGLNGYEFSCV